MFGMLTVAEETGHSRLWSPPGTVYGHRFYRMTVFHWACVTLSDRWSDSRREKRVAEALLQLRARGLRPVTVPDNWRELAISMKLEPVDVGPALQACACAVALEGCRAMGFSAKDTCLAVCGSDIRGPVQAELLALARVMGGICLQGADNEAIRCKLCRGGVTPLAELPQDRPVLGLLLPGGTVPEAAALTADLRGDGAMAGPGLWQPVLQPPVDAMAQLQDGVPPQAFAAALLTCGAIRPREIRVSRLDIAEGTQYNKELYSG